MEDSIEVHLKQLKIKLPAVPFLGIHPKEIKSLCQRDTYTLMIIVAKYNSPNMHAKYSEKHSIA